MKFSHHGSIPSKNNYNLEKIVIYKTEWIPDTIKWIFSRNIKYQLTQIKIFNYTG